MFASISRRDGREHLQYGELVALSGDFYETPEELFNEKPSPLPWLYESNDLSDLQKIFSNELQWIEARQQGKGSKTYPNENIRLAWNAKSYVELALRNTDHFGWHNIVTYCKYHAEALQLASSSRGQETDIFRQALYTNAFADHFLTDGFAAGHIRVPRSEILCWAQNKGYGERLRDFCASFFMTKTDISISTHFMALSTRIFALRKTDFAYKIRLGCLGTLTAMDNYLWKYKKENLQLIVLC